MSKYLKLLTVLCCNVAIVELSAFEWNFSTSVSTQSGNVAESKTSIERWAVGQGRFWDKQDWRVGDFDGDGVDDLARVFLDGRDVSIDVYRSDGNAFTMKPWALQQGRFLDEQAWRVGDFDGDGVDDLARVFRDGRNVSIDVYRSSGNGFTMKSWALQQGRFWEEQDWRAGDFDGDGVDDLARVFRDGRDVSIDVYRSDGNAFTMKPWAAQQGRFWIDQHWQVGDFDGDGVDDLARVFLDGRYVSIDVYRSDGNAFTMKPWAAQQGRFWDEQDWRVGDFDGDGVDDLARVFLDGRDVSVDLYRSSKKSFVFKNSLLQQGRFLDKQYWRAGDFNGDGTDNLAKIYEDGRNVSIDVYPNKLN